MEETRIVSMPMTARLVHLGGSSTLFVIHMGSRVARELKQHEELIRVALNVATDGNIRVVDAIKWLI